MFLHIRKAAHVVGIIAGDQSFRDGAQRFLIPIGIRIIDFLQPFQPRKNLAVLYAAMRILDTRGRAIPLVLCGPRGIHGYKPGDELPDWLRHAGFVSDTELAALYSRATALVIAEARIHSML